MLRQIQEREMLGDSLGLIKFFYFWSKGRKLLGWACWGFVQGLMPGRDTGLGQGNPYGCGWDKGLPTAPHCSGTAWLGRS